VDALFKPNVRLGLLCAIGQLLCWITGILLLGVPYKYWLYALELEPFNLQAFSMPMLGLLSAHLLLAMVFLVPAMTEKYLRSNDSILQKIGVRLFVIAVFLLLGFSSDHL